MPERPNSSKVVRTPLCHKLPLHRFASRVRAHREPPHLAPAATAAAAVVLHAYHRPRRPSQEEEDIRACTTKATPRVSSLTEGTFYETHLSMENTSRWVLQNLRPLDEDTPAHNGCPGPRYPSEKNTNRTPPLFSHFACSSLRLVSSAGSSLCLISSAKKATAVASSARGATGGSRRRHLPPRPLQQSSSTPSSSSATPSCCRHRPPVKVVPALAVAEGDRSCVVMGGSAPPSPRWPDPDGAAPAAPHRDIGQTQQLLLLQMQARGQE